jgi:hypothetical protein
LFVLFEEEEKEEKENGKLNAKSFFISFVFVFFIKASEGKRGIGIIDSSAPIRRRGRNGDDDSRGGNEDEEETKRRENNNDEKEDLLDSCVVHFCAKVVTEEALRIVISLCVWNNRSLLVVSMIFQRDFRTVFV